MKKKKVQQMNLEWVYDGRGGVKEGVGLGYSSPGSFGKH